MDGSVFTHEELLEMSIKDLQLILDYLKLPYDKRSKKASLIVLVEEYLKPLTVTSYPDVVNSIMSARVQRIYEQMEKEKNGTIN